MLTGRAAQTLRGDNKDRAWRIGTPVPILACDEMVQAREAEPQEAPRPATPAQQLLPPSAKITRVQMTWSLAAPRKHLK